MRTPIPRQIQNQAGIGESAPARVVDIGGLPAPWVMLIGELPMLIGELPMLKTVVRLNIEETSPLRGGSNRLTWTQKRPLAVLRSRTDPGAAAGHQVEDEGALVIERAVNDSEAWAILET